MLGLALPPPLSRRRAPQRLPKKGFALFEAQPSLQSPGSIEEYPMRGINSGHPAFSGTSDWVPFLFGSFFFGQAKKKNRRMKPIPSATEVA